MRIVEFEIEGTLYPLNFSTKAYKVVIEKYGSFKSLNEALKDPSEIVNMLALLIDQGVAYKEINGEDRKLITSEEIEVVTSFKDIPRMRSAIYEAIMIGAHRTIETEDTGKKNAQCR